MAKNTKKETKVKENPKFKDEMLARAFKATPKLPQALVPTNETKSKKTTSSIPIQMTPQAQAVQVKTQTEVIVLIEPKLANAYLDTLDKISPLEEELQLYRSTIEKTLIMNNAKTGVLDSANKIHYRAGGVSKSLNKTKVEDFIASHGENIEDFYIVTPKSATYAFPKKRKEIK